MVTRPVPDNIYYSSSRNLERTGVGEGVGRPLEERNLTPTPAAEIGSVHVHASDLLRSQE